MFKKWNAKSLLKNKTCVSPPGNDSSDSNPFRKRSLVYIRALLNENIKLRQIAYLSGLIIALTAILVIFFSDHDLALILGRAIGIFGVPFLFGLGWRYVWEDFENPVKFLAYWCSAAQFVSLITNLVRIPQSSWGVSGVIMIVATTTLMVANIMGYFRSWRGNVATIGIIILNLVATFWLILNNLENVNLWMIGDYPDEGLSLLGGIITDIGLLNPFTSLAPQIFMLDLDTRIREHEFYSNIMEPNETERQLTHIREQRITQRPEAQQETEHSPPKNQYCARARKIKDVKHRILLNKKEKLSQVRSEKEKNGLSSSSPTLGLKLEQEVQSTQPVLKAIDLTKKFGDFTAVDHINFEVKKGEVFGLLGHNGAGKTTTINLLVGLMQPTEGTAIVSGYDVLEEPLEARRRIGVLPDNPGNYLHLTARQNLEFFAELADVPRKIADERIGELLELVKLTDWGDAKVETYSRGMKQRLGLAQCLIRDPDVLFFDEPTLGIDPEGTREIRGLIRKLAEEQGKTMLICSHLLHEVSRICDRVAIMRWGRIVAMGTISDLRERLGLGDQIDLEEIFIRYQGVE